MVYLCAQCDSEVHFGSPEHMQSTLFRDREIFTDGQWQHIDRNLKILSSSSPGGWWGINSTTAIDLFILPDVPCRCPNSRWHFTDNSQQCDLLIVHDGVRVFKTAKYICGGCGVVVNQQKPSACNQGFFPLEFDVKAKGPVKWISIYTLHVLQSLVCSSGGVVGVGFRLFVTLVVLCLNWHFCSD
jgi:DNA-directed RNA polymerase subunit RPC12/RpoP